jgi:hypothetical protein
MESILSDIVLVVHFAWIIFIILAFPVSLCFRLSSLRIFHTVALVFTIIMQATGTLCPLTILEEYLRRKKTAGFTYDGSFIISWLRRLIYIEDLGVSLVVIHVLTLAFLAFVFLSYFWWPLKRKEG